MTHALRADLSSGLEEFGWKIIPGVANFILCRLPLDGPSATEIIEACRFQDLFLRNPGSMGSETDDRLIRIAVKDAETNAKMLRIIQESQN
ncbi:hypothetical protein N9021_02075 [Akkermansiaceae bacterium]|nr:hypothetical protein [Akkermansiaceae bacterium]